MSGLEYIAPPIIQAGAQMIGLNDQQKTDRQINDINWRRQKLLIQQQREWALSDWDKVNAYNSPMQQMQRYKDAGLNPHLIYGNAQNSPAAMVRQSSASPVEARQTANAQQAYANIGMAAQNAMNAYFANKRLENETNLTNAQILGIKANTDKTDWANKLTQATFNDLVAKLRLENTNTMWDNSIKKRQFQSMPDASVARENYSKNMERTIELLKLAQQEGKLKQADIDMIENLKGVRGGEKMLFEFAKMILQGGINRYSK